jgi:hypothetical protein
MITCTADSQRAMSQMTTMKQENKHFPEWSRSGLSTNVVVHDDSVEGNKTTCSAEHYRRETDSYFGRCVERHQALLINVLTSYVINRNLAYLTATLVNTLTLWTFPLYVLRFNILLRHGERIVPSLQAGFFQYKCCYIKNIYTLIKQGLNSCKYYTPTNASIVYYILV